MPDHVIISKGTHDLLAITALGNKLISISILRGLVNTPASGY